MSSNGANKALRKLNTYLGRAPQHRQQRHLEETFARQLSLARRVRDQDHRQRGPKVYFPARARGRMHW
jgi:hypothetical protein